MDYTAGRIDYPPSAVAPLVARRIEGIHASEDVKKPLRLYLMVGIILFCGTIATFSVATVPALDMGGRGFDKWDALLALGIATFKASLVAAVFMHLNHERRAIYMLILLGVIVVSGLFIGMYTHYVEFPADPYFYSNQESPPFEGFHGAKSTR